MINAIIYILIFFVGGSLGSFVGVIVDRLNIKSYFKGRSVCQSCNKNLSWYEMIPVFSYLFLRGRCKKCKVNIGSEHFWVEVAGGFLAVLVYIFYISNYFIYPIFSKNLILGILLSFMFALLFIVLSVIFIYDIRHKLVPTGFAILLIIIGLAFEAYKAFNYNVYYGALTNLFWLDLFSGFLIALPFFLIYIFSKRKGVGFGDILIFFGIGYLSGFIFGVSILLLSIWIGAFVSILLMYFKPKRYNKKTAIPFAPFIIIATLLVIFLQLDIVGLTSIL